jgi:hypothetical protein
MKRSVNACGLLLALVAAAPVCAAIDRWDSPIGLRLPGDGGSVQLDFRSPLPRLWVSHMVDSGRQWRKAWRVQSSGSERVYSSDDVPLRLFRSRTHASLNWEPVQMGAWKLGAAMGVMKDLPGAAHGTTTFATFPVATYEEPSYRFNMGWLPSRGQRDAMLLMRVVLPLR